MSGSDENRPRMRVQVDNACETRGLSTKDKAIVGHSVNLNGKVWKSIGVIY